MDECSGWALCGCSWMKTVPPVDGGYVLHLFPSFHPQLQARPAPDFWSVETHLARHLRPPWSRSRDDSSSALCWWRFLSARLGFLWRKASLLQSNGETTLTVVPIHIFHIQHSWIMFIHTVLTGFLCEDKSAKVEPEQLEMCIRLSVSHRVVSKIVTSKDCKQIRRKLSKLFKNFQCRCNKHCLCYFPVFIWTTWCICGLQAMEHDRITQQ